MMGRYTDIFDKLNRAQQRELDTIEANRPRFVITDLVAYAIMVLCVAAVALPALIVFQPNLQSLFTWF